MITNIDKVTAIYATSESNAYTVFGDFTVGEAQELDASYTTRPGDAAPLNVALQQWLTDHQGEYTVHPYVPPIPVPVAYRISKTTPWLRMTDAEGDLVYAAMSETSSRLRAIYDAATYLSSDDPLWTTMHDILAATLSPARADQLLAPET